MVSRPYRQIDAIGLDWLFPRTARRAGLSAPTDHDRNLPLEALIAWDEATVGRVSKGVQHVLRSAKKIALRSMPRKMTCMGKTAATMRACRATDRSLSCSNSGTDDSRKPWSVLRPLSPLVPWRVAIRLPYPCSKS